MVSSEGLSVMPQGGHKQMFCILGYSIGKSSVLAFACPQLGRKVRGKDPETVSWQRFAYFSEFQTHPSPTPTHHN